MRYIGHELMRRWAQNSTGLSHRNAFCGISDFPKENRWTTMETDSLNTGISLNYA
jgi:hypothetical protein